MHGYLFIIYYNSPYTIDKLYIIVSARDGVEAALKAEERLKAAGQDGVQITGVERLV